jgi:lysophospholipase L1-like esterase
VYREHLARRRPDLLMLAYGTNEIGDDDVPIELYESRLRRVLERARQVAAQASCLLIGPSDRPLRNDDGSFSDRPLTSAVIDVQRRLAREFGCGFFDLRRFMGGPMSMLSWVDAVPPLGSRDYVHFTAAGYERLAESLHASLLDGLPTAPTDAIAASPAAPAAAQALPRADK